VKRGKTLQLRYIIRGINPLRMDQISGERCRVMGLFGGRPSLERLVNEHYQSLYRYAHRLTGSSADAEDLTQESFCKAQEKLAQLRDPERTKAWLFRILRNTYLQKIRNDARQPCVILDDWNNVPEHAPQPLPMIEPERLQEALAELPETFRTPVILYYLEDFSYRDIADQMEIPLGTVMSRLSRAKAHLRASLLQPEAEAPVQEFRRGTDGL
jgi:RNA polymerase sigma factor (sigma-70 family)